MTGNQHAIVHLLLTPGRYLMKSQSYPGFYVLYEGNQVPVRRTKICRSLERLLKADRKRRYTIHLSRVRQLHGNNYIKRIYLKKFTLK